MVNQPFGKELIEEAELKDTGAIVVGASDKNDKQLEISNFGDAVNVYAPGTNLHTLLPNGLTTSNFGGTSGAAAIIAGKVALLQSIYSELTPRQLRELLD